MALRLFDGFDSYGAAAQLAGRWLGGTNASLLTTGGVDGAGCASLATNVSGHLIGNIPGAAITDVFIAQGHFRIQSTQGIGTSLWIQAQNASASAIFTLARNSSRMLYVARGGRTGSVILPDIAQANDDTFYHVGLMVVIHASAGEVYVWVDGDLAASGTSLNTAGASGGATRVRLNDAPASQNSIMRVDNFILMDDAGSHNTTYRPHASCKVFFPGADTSEIEFTPSEGSLNFENVNAIQSTVTRYNESSTTGYRDRFTMAAVGLASNVTVAGLQLVSIAQQPTGGAAALIYLLDTPGASEQQGDPVTLPLASYGSQAGLLQEENPDTGDLYQPDELEYLEIGYEAA
jgi:hypothetical protein